MLRKPFALAGLVALLAMPAAAQTVGTPVYMAPYRAFTTMELGIALSDPGPGFALEGSYRYGSGRFDIGIRGGLLNEERMAGDELFLLAGADVRFRVLDHTEDFPLDGSFTAGVGGAIGDDSRLYLPAGLSLGRRVELEDGISFVPYLHPVVTVAVGDETDILVSLGVGVDFKVSRSLDLRVSGGIGDLDGIAIGLSWIK